MFIKGGPYGRNFLGSLRASLMRLLICWLVSAWVCSLSSYSWLAYSDCYDIDSIL